MLTIACQVVRLQRSLKHEFTGMETIVFCRMLEMMYCGIYQKLLKVIGNIEC